MVCHGKFYHPRTLSDICHRNKLTSTSERRIIMLAVAAPVMMLVRTQAEMLAMMTSDRKLSLCLEAMCFVAQADTPESCE